MKEKIYKKIDNKPYKEGEIAAKIVTGIGVATYITGACIGNPDVMDCGIYIVLPSVGFLIGRKAAETQYTETKKFIPKHRGKGLEKKLR